MSIGRETSTYKHTFDISGCILSKQEKICLILVINGYGNKEIANFLFISESAVKKIFESIFRKLNVHNRASAVAVAIFHNIITDEMCHDFEQNSNITLLEVFYKNNRNGKRI